MNKRFFFSNALVDFLRRRGLGLRFTGAPKAANRESEKGNSESASPVKVGRGTYWVPEVIHWNEGAVLSIGSYCSIAKGVQVLLGGNHRLDWCTTYPFNKKFPELMHWPGHPSTKGNVEIGHDVWVGQDALILSGVKIGTGAVIGARSVVSRDIPPYAIAAGNPARIIRRRFNDSTCERLLASKWWELDEAELVQLAPLLMSDDAESMLDQLSVIRSVVCLREINS